MQNILVKRLISTGMITLLVLTSCRALNTVYIAAEAQEVLKKGDKVIVHLKDGRELRFKIVEINAEVITGENERVPISEIVRIEKAKIDAWRTVALIFAGLSLAATVIFAYAMSQSFYI